MSKRDQRREARRAKPRRVRMMDDDWGPTGYEETNDGGPRRRGGTKAPGHGRWAQRQAHLLACIDKLAPLPPEARLPLSYVYAGASVGRWSLSPTPENVQRAEARLRRR